MSMSELSGRVLRIERSSIHDGEGLRTVVFLKGCPLSCAWCSTPESQSPEMEQGTDRIYGSIMSVDQVIKEVEKDKIFFFHSGGGMTISGGEPLLQPAFTAEILRQCKFLGINTAMESCLFVPFGELQRILYYLDTLYVDLKFVNGKKHEKYCGHNNAVILDNIRRVTSENQSLDVVIRIPLIPGINDGYDELAAAAEFCQELSFVSAIQLLPYHRLGVPTYEKLGRSYRLKDIRPPETEYFQNRKIYFSSCVKNIKLI